MEGLEPANDDRRTTCRGGDYASASPGARSGQRILLAEADATQTAPGDGVSVVVLAAPPDTSAVADVSRARSCSAGKRLGK